MPEQRGAAVIVETTECHGCLDQKYIVIDQECCTVRQRSGSQPPFHPSAVSSYSSTVGMNWSSHNEAFSSQLCSSGFQFHTQPSVSPPSLSATHAAHDGSLPLRPLVVLQSAPLSLRVPLAFFCRSHTVAHGDTAPLITSLFVALHKQVDGCAKPKNLYMRLI